MIAKPIERKKDSTLIWRLLGPNQFKQNRPDKRSTCLNGGGGGVISSSFCRSRCRLSVKISLLCRFSLKNFRPLSVVGKSQLIFLSLVGNFLLVLSVVSNIFSPFVSSRLLIHEQKRRKTHHTSCTAVAPE